MATITGYNVYTESWRGWREPTHSNPFTNYNNVGPYDGNKHARTVIRLNLAAIASNYIRDKLTISTTLTIPSTSSTFNSNEKFVAVLTNNFDSDGYAPDSSNYQSDGSYLKEYVVTMTVSEGGTYTPVWNIDISNYPKTETTVYVYIYSGNSISGSGGYNTSKMSAATASETSKILYSNVTTGTVTSGTTIYKPGASITAKWSACSSGTNNAVNHINIYYKIGSVPTSSSPGVSLSNNVSASATSYKFTLPTSATRGSAIYVAIQAIGSVSGYNGSLKYAKIGSVNNLPKAPTVDSSGNEVAGNTSVTFTITKGSDADSSQSTAIYYKINSGTRQSLSSTTLTISTSTTTSGIASGTNTIYFYTNDGLEDSAATSKTIEVIYAPVLNSASISYTKVNNGSTNTATLAKTGIISYTMGRDVSNPAALFKIRTASTSSGLTGSFAAATLSHSIDNSSKKITIDVMNSSAIPAGHYFEIQVAIQDSYGTSAYKTLTIGQKPATAVGISSISLTTDGNSKAKSNYFNNNVTISFKNPSANVSRPDITSIKIYADSKEFTCSNVTEGANPSVVLDLSTNSRNKTISFSVVLTDAAGQSVTSNASSTLTRTSEIKFEGTEWDVNLTTFKPYTTPKSLVLNPTNATATGTDSANIEYQYKIKINNIERSLSSTTTTAEDLRNLINEIISENERNTSYMATITVTAIDGFGVSTSLPQKNITIDYVEAPTFANSYDIKIKHDFYIGTSSITTSTGTEVTDNLDLNNAARLFNPGEGIIFMLPKATDYNNDIFKYQIYISRNNIPNTSTVPIAIDAATFEESPWLSLTPSQLTVSDSNYYYYRYKASQYSQNQYYYFKLIVEDSKGNKTEARYSNTYIVGCRVTKPSFTTGVIKSTRTEDKSSVTLNYNLSITDLGGSAPSTGWDKNYYSKFPNIDKLTLIVEICDNASFNGNNLRSESIPATTDLQNFTHSELTFSDVGSWSKIYMRFSIKIDYGQISSTDVASLTSDYFIDAYVGNVPTVSHRSHQVGINTNALQSGEVLVVETYSGNNLVVLRNAANGDTITINLVDRTISGLSYLDGVVINGGTW